MPSQLSKFPAQVSAGQACRISLCGCRVCSAHAPKPGAGSRRLSRRLLLKGLLAGAGCSLFELPPGRAEALPGSDAAPDVSPFDLQFEIVERFRPVELLPRRFAQVGERFGNGHLVSFMRQGLRAAGEPPEVTRTPGGLRISALDDALTVYRSEAGPAAPYATAIVEVEPAREGAAQAVVAPGLFRDAQNYVVASFDLGEPGRARVSIDVMGQGVPTRLALAEADLTGARQLAFVLNGNMVTALAGDSAGWTAIAQSDVGALLDFRDPTNLASHRHGFGVGGAARSVEIGGFQAGHFGLVGMRDPHVISYADGAPYIGDGKLYFTATHAGLVFPQGAHWGVWTLDLNNLGSIENVAQLFFARGGLVLGDHAGHIVIDEQETGFHIAVSGWGDFDYKGVQVHYLHTGTNVLEGVHVLESAVMSLPTEVSSWDPSMARIGGRWHVAFVESPYQDRQRGFDFRPALARGSAGGTLGELTRVGADLSRGETEGVILQKIGGEWYLLASDGDDRRYRVYDLAMKHLGFLDAPYGTNIPHPQIVPISHGGRTSYLMLTFDGTPFAPQFGYGSHGDFIVMRATRQVPGQEFAPR